MPYFLDGNNLIGRSRPTEEDRSALIGEIAERLRRTRARAVLFFDGTRRRETSLGTLTVREGFGPSADEDILTQVTRTRAASEITVVTADRALAGRVRDAGARSTTPPEFWSRFGKASPQQEKGTGPVDLEDWMKYFEDEKNRT